MKQLLTLFILALSLIGFNSVSYAAEQGAKSVDIQIAMADEGDDKKKKKKGEEEEEPECD